MIRKYARDIAAVILSLMYAISPANAELPTDYKTWKITRVSREERSITYKKYKDRNDSPIVREFVSELETQGLRIEAYVVGYNPGTEYPIKKKPLEVYVKLGDSPITLNKKVIGTLEDIAKARCGRCHIITNLRHKY